MEINDYRFHFSLCLYRFSVPLLHNPRLATLVAFVHCLEATTQDDALEVLEALLRELFGDAIKADNKARQRTMKDLDQAAITLAKACQMVLDDTLSDSELRAKLFEKIPREMLTRALAITLH